MIRRLRSWLRRFWAQRESLTPGRQLLVEWATLAVVPTLILLGVCGWLLWDLWLAVALLAGAASPFGTRCPPAAVVLMVWGFLLVPAAIGALASFALERRLAGQQRQLDEALEQTQRWAAELRSQAGGDLT